MSALHTAHDLIHMASSPKTRNVSLKPTFLIRPAGIAPACLLAALLCGICHRNFLPRLFKIEQTQN
jgi:hypothetical protein